MDGKPARRGLAVTVLVCLVLAGAPSGDAAADAGSGVDVLWRTNVETAPPELLFVSESRLRDPGIALLEPRPAALRALDALIARAREAADPDAKDPSLDHLNLSPSDRARIEERLARNAKAIKERLTPFQAVADVLGCYYSHRTFARHRLADSFEELIAAFPFVGTATVMHRTAGWSGRKSRPSVLLTVTIDQVYAGDDIASTGSRRFLISYETALLHAFGISLCHVAEEGEPAPQPGDKLLIVAYRHEPAEQDGLLEGGYFLLRDGEVYSTPGSLVPSAGPIPIADVLRLTKSSRSVQSLARSE